MTTTETKTATHERGIIFSAPMVREILAGRKTMTRRLAKGGKADNRFKVGDTLWVKETWMPVDTGFRVPARPHIARDKEGRVRVIVYRATDEFHCDWCNSMFMPRWASRITLRITSVKAEWVNEITEADARAEGRESVAAFAELWDELHGKGSFARGEWVWVIGFEVL